MELATGAHDHAQAGIRRVPVLVRISTEKSQTFETGCLAIDEREAIELPAVSA